MSIERTPWKSKKDIIIFVVALIFIVGYNLINFSTLYLESPDGNMYISIARNFYSTGHFIQNVRISENAMVVPPGLPIVYCLLFILFRNIYAILFFQYILYGISVVLLYKIISIYVKNEWIICVAVLAFLFNNDILLYVNPAYLLTETWTNVLMLIWIMFFVQEDGENTKRVEWLNITALLITIIRPVFSILIFPSIIIMIRQMTKRKVKKYIFIYGIFVLILFGNVINNYRETKSMVLFENYAGASLYIANNVNTKLMPYYSDTVNDFVEPRFLEMENDASMTRGEKNAIYKVWAKTYINEHFYITVVNSMKKFYMLFVKSFGLDFYFAILGVVLYTINKKGKLLTVFLTYMIIAGITSFGLIVGRYSSFVVPLLIILKFLLLDTIVNAMKKRLTRYI